VIGSGRCRPPAQARLCRWQRLRDPVDSTSKWSKLFRPISLLSAEPLGRPDLVERTAFVLEPRKLPVVLSPEKGARLLEAAPALKYKAALSVAYGAGSRVSEVVALKVGIDSKRMIIRIEQGKGRKDRYVMLSPHLLELLRAWWRAARPQGWLFPRRNPVQPMTTRQLNRACHAAADMAGIGKPVSMHTLAPQLRHPS